MKETGGTAECLSDGKESCRRWSGCFIRIILSSLLFTADGVWKNCFDSVVLFRIKMRFILWVLKAVKNKILKT